MIKIYNNQTRQRVPVDGCQEMLRQVESSPKFRVFFFVCGVGQQLNNLDILPGESAIGEMSQEILPCWWRIFDSGYRPNEEELDMFCRVALMDQDTTEDSLSHFMFWYERYIKSDFFGNSGLRPNEHN